MNPHSESEVLESLVRWGEGQPAVRAMILTSSRTVPDATLDPFSDYDVILALEDIRPFQEATYVAKYLSWVPKREQQTSHHRFPVISV